MNILEDPNLGFTALDGVPVTSCLGWLEKQAYKTKTTVNNVKVLGQPLSHKRGHKTLINK